MGGSAWIVAALPPLAGHVLGMARPLLLCALTPLWLAAVRRHGADQTRAAMACLPLPLPASPAVVGAAAAGKIVAALCQQHARV